MIKKEAQCIRADLDDNVACARAGIKCPPSRSTCKVVEGRPTCVSALALPPGVNQSPCENSPCGPATGTKCAVVDGEAKCLPNVVG